MKNVFRPRIHRGDDGEDQAFYWDKETGEKITDPVLIEKLDRVYTTEENYPE